MDNSPDIQQFLIELINRARLDLPGAQLQPLAASKVLGDNAQWLAELTMGAKFDNRTAFERAVDNGYRMIGSGFAVEVSSHRATDIPTDMESAVAGYWSSLYGSPWTS
jgi:hypothetical protein